MTFRGNHVDELISASLTGDLTDAERAQLGAHLARCERCRATLSAFKAERRILSGLPVSGTPRDLSARVRSGIESGRFAGPWWRRPGSVVPMLASAAVFAAVVLAAVFLGKLPTGPVGQASGSPSASPSSAPSSSGVASASPSAGPTAPPVFLGSGQLGYLSLNGGSLQPSHLSFMNDATGGSIDLGTVSGPPIAAALSPDGQWLAYITQKGETGANEVWALHLTDSSVVPLGCSEAASFTDRLAWSSDGTYLAFTLVAADLGSASGCPANDGAAGTADAWVYDVAHGERLRLTRSGNAYSATFMPGNDQATLLVSFAAERPWTEAVPLAADPSSLDRIEGVFLPLISADGSRAIFWNGTMTSNGGSWHFSLGGMPQLSGDFRSAGAASPWVGTPLFGDLVLVGGEGFASGEFAWGPDSDLVAFWNGAWTGAPQSADGSYPNQQDVYLGRVSGGLLSATSQIDLGNSVTDSSWIVDVALSGLQGNYEAAVTIGLPSAGIGDPPSARLVRATNASVGVGGGGGGGGGVEPPSWQGPAVYGP
jgi:hypothetical protein